MHVLFVCTQNKWRSLTAEQIFSGYQGIQVRSVGTATNARRVISVNDIEWSDLIFVMENEHKEKLKEKFSQYVSQTKMVVLDIPDEFEFMDEDLVEMLKRSVEPYLS